MWLSSALPQHPSAVRSSNPNAFVQPHLHQGAALEEVTLGLIVKGAVELAPLPSPGFYSRLFVVWKTLGSWRPVIDLSHLNRFVDVSHFQMETIQSALLSVRQGDWFTRILVTFCASCSETASSSSKRCALASPRLRRSSLGSWLLYPQFSILWGSV